MQLIVLGSSSAGNSYLLQNDQESLLIECGVRFDAIKKALKYKLNKVAGCLLTHEDGDHCKSIKDVLAAGIKVYSSKGTHLACGTALHHRSMKIKSGDQVKIGGFLVRAFDTKHDAAEPLGFLIYHPETGNILFLTDSYYSEYQFPNLNQVIIEANYCDKILNKRMFDQKIDKSLRNRIVQSHMSLKTCKETLAANDLSQVQNIVLIHLSDGNSDEARFKREVEELTGKTVYVASKGLIIQLNKEVF